MPPAASRTSRVTFDDVNMQYRAELRAGGTTTHVSDAFGLDLQLVYDSLNQFVVEVSGPRLGSLDTKTLIVSGPENLALCATAFNKIKAQGGPDEMRKQKIARLGRYGLGPNTRRQVYQSTPNSTGGSSVTTKTCQDCPALVKASEVSKQRALFGAPVGLAMCGRRGIPLSTRHSDMRQSEKIKEAAAATCPDYGVEHDGGPAWPFLFAQPHPSHQKPAPELDINDPDAFIPPAEACSGCLNYIAPKVMQERFGIPLAGCATFGSLIPVGQGQIRADGCKYNRAPYVPGTTGYAVDMTKLDLAAHLHGRVTIIDSESGDAELPTTTATVDEPTEIETDKEVTEADVAKGIRAWVKLTDPGDSGNHVFMPVFRREFFSTEEQSKIPQTGEDAHPELYNDHLGLLYKAVVIWRHLNETPALNGVAGTGKTELFRYVAWRMQLPFERISITASTEIDDLAGRTLFENSETLFQYGRIPKAWAKPCVIVIDEPNVGPSEVWQFLRPLTDNAKQLVLDMNKGERIDRNEHCFMGMAFNPSWDMRNVGTHEISDADGRRLMHIAVPTPTKEVERDIITRRCLADGYKIPVATLKAIMGIAEDLRALAKNDTIPIQWGTAQNIKVARASQFFGLKDCYRMAAADLLEPAACDQILDTVKSHMAGKKASANNPPF